MPVRIAIIGAGASGLSQLHAFECARRAGEKSLPEIVCFEKQSDWGGLWKYTWRTGLDEYGEPVHGSMYHNLWSNVPKEFLEYADYSFDEHFGHPIPSYISREVIYHYFTTRAEKSGIRKYIQFDTVVRWVSYSEETKKFTVIVKNQKTARTVSSEFDYIVVASGHFSTPNMPSFEGIEDFPGRVLHSHDFRDAREFAGKRILIVGSGFSAEDIGLQCYKYGATSVTFSYRKKPMEYTWPATLKEVSILTKVDGHKVYFKNGSNEEVDAIILCTGYLHHFPYLSDNLCLRSDNRFYPVGLYKGLFLPNNTRVIYLGMQNQLFTFMMFEVQAWYVRDVILQKIKLPSDPQTMVADIATWAKREANFENPFFDAVALQTDYVEELAKATDCPHHDFRKISDYLVNWMHIRKRNILTFRNIPHASVVTGTIASEPDTTWEHEKDDAVFLKYTAF